MIDLNKLVKDKKYPTKIRDGIKPVLKVKTNIEKIFSKFGLNDFRVGLNKEQRKMISYVDKEMRIDVIENLRDEGVRLKTKNLDIIKKCIDLGWYGLNGLDKYSNYFSKLANNKNLKIVFSTNPWDIATMSMRGITSCMEWRSNNSITLSGSIVDPCVAVIYLTDGTKTKHGEKMLARSVIRLTTVSNKEPQILIENSYIANSFFDINNDNYFIENVCLNELFDELFFNLLNSKLKNKIKCKAYVIQNMRVPKTPEVNSLNPLNLSYRDSHIQYTDDIISLDSLIPQKQPKKKSAAKTKKK